MHNSLIHGADVILVAREHISASGSHDTAPGSAPVSYAWLRSVRLEITVFFFVAERLLCLDEIVAFFLGAGFLLADFLAGLGFASAATSFFFATGLAGAEGVGLASLFTAFLASLVLVARGLALIARVFGTLSALATGAVLVGGAESAISNPKSLERSSPPRTFAGRFLRARNRLAGAGDQFLFVDVAQPEEQLRLLVQTGAYAIENSSDMLAHLRPIRATARKLDLFGRREKPGLLLADALHHALGEPSLQEFDQRINRARAIIADRLPVRLAQPEGSPLRPCRSPSR